MRRGAFTLVEVIAALAIFAIVAVVIGQASFNAVYAVSRLKKDPMSDVYKDFLREQIVKISSYKEIQSGLDLQDPMGEQIRVEGEAEATGIMDLFILRVASKESGYSDVFYLNRPSWYDEIVSMTNREDILRDRNEYLEESRRSNFRERDSE